MSLADLLAELDARHIVIEVIGGRMRVDAPKGALSAGLQAALQGHRSALLALLPREAAHAGAGSPGKSPSPEPASERDPLLLSAMDAGATVRIPLDDLVYGDFLERNGLRIVNGTAYPDGRTYRPTIYLASG
jgi:hypothetical protein